jgi:uncharacterized membrane protein YczE
MIYPMNKLETIFKKDHMVKRILMSIFGVLICGIAVGFFKRAMFGVDPFQSLMAGLDCVIPIDFGTLYVIVNVVMLLFSLLLSYSIGSKSAAPCLHSGQTKSSGSSSPS